MTLLRLVHRPSRQLLLPLGLRLHRLHSVMMMPMMTFMRNSIHSEIHFFLGKEVFLCYISVQI